MIRPDRKRHAESRGGRGLTGTQLVTRCHLSQSLSVSFNSLMALLIRIVTDYYLAITCVRWKVALFNNFPCLCRPTLIFTVVICMVMLDHLCNADYDHALPMLLFFTLINGKRDLRLLCYFMAFVHVCCQYINHIVYEMLRNINESILKVWNLYFIVVK